MLLTKPNIKTRDTGTDKQTGSTEEHQTRDGESKRKVETELELWAHQQRKLKGGEGSEQAGNVHHCRTNDRCMHHWYFNKVGSQKSVSSRAPLLPAAGIMGYTITDRERPFIIPGSQCSGDALEAKQSFHSCCEVIRIAKLHIGPQIGIICLTGRLFQRAGRLVNILQCREAVCGRKTIAGHCVVEHDCHDFMITEDICCIVQWWKVLKASTFFSV